jgi:Fe2+ or Zn2+ uptake regulation protein
MTTRHFRPDSPGYIEQLRRLRLRLTPQRLVVLEALATHGGHMTADEILQWVAQRYPDISLATIYRILDLLISAGLVSRADLGGNATCFELIGDSPHHHLVCTRCGTIIELDGTLLAPLRERILCEYGFQVDPRHLALFGICRRCLTAGQTRTMPQETTHP